MPSSNTQQKIHETSASISDAIPSLHIGNQSEKADGSSGAKELTIRAADYFKTDKSMVGTSEEVSTIKLTRKTRERVDVINAGRSTVELNIQPVESSQLRFHGSSVKMRVVEDSTRNKSAQCDVSTYPKTPDETSLHRDAHHTHGPGAFNIVGIADDSADSFCTGEDSLCFESSATANLASPETAFEARLAPSRTQNDNREENILFVNAVNEVDDKTYAKKRQITVAFFIVFIAAVVGIVVWIYFGTRSSDDVVPITVEPTSAPTTKTFRNGVIRDFLRSSLVEDIPVEEGSPFALSVDWILNEDPLQIKTMDGSLLQRFALVMFYFETTNGGTRYWRRCSQPYEEEDDLCFKSTRDTNRWLTGTDECSWFGITCNNVGFVVEIRLVRNNLAGSFPSAMSMLSVRQR